MEAGIRVETPVGESWVYSLDGQTWQAEPVFLELAPGVAFVLNVLYTIFCLHQPTGQQTLATVQFGRTQTETDAQDLDDVCDRGAETDKILRTGGYQRTGMGDTYSAEGCAVWFGIPSPDGSVNTWQLEKMLWSRAAEYVVDRMNLDWQELLMTRLAGQERPALAFINNLHPNALARLCARLTEINCAGDGTGGGGNPPTPTITSIRIQPIAPLSEGTAATIKTIAYLSDNSSYEVTYNCDYTVDDDDVEVTDLYILAANTNNVLGDDRTVHLTAVLRSNLAITHSRPVAIVDTTPALTTPAPSYTFGQHYIERQAAPPPTGPTNPANPAPQLYNPQPDTVIESTGIQTFTLPVNEFIDPGDTITLGVTQTNGQPLPAGITYDAQTRTFTVAESYANGAVAIRVTATDSVGQTATDEFLLTVARRTYSRLALNLPPAMNEGQELQAMATAVYQNANGTESGENVGALGTWSMATETGSFLTAPCTIDGDTLDGDGTVTAATNGTRGDTRRRRVQVAYKGKTISATVQINDQTPAPPVPPATPPIIIAVDWEFDAVTPTAASSLMGFAKASADCTIEWRFQYFGNNGYVYEPNWQQTSAPAGFYIPCYGAGGSELNSSVRLLIRVVENPQSQVAIDIQQSQLTGSVARHQVYPN